jgi:2'-5' RNA ligase
MYNISNWRYLEIWLSTRYAPKKPFSKVNSMYYALIIYPQLSAELFQSIDTIRGKYDPTSGFTKPHITVLFPVPGSGGEGRLISHIQNVLSDWSPFEIRLGGFHKSHDHWLFLTLIEGETQVKKLYQALYTGILAEYRRDDIEFVPHLGLGLFINESSTYDWDNLRASDFDREQYEEAWRQAKALPLSSSILVEKLQLTKIPDAILEWATGKRISIPEDSCIVEVQKFRLCPHGA